MSVASVTIHYGAFADARISYLARLAGYADADHALGKLARLWGRCTFLGTDVPGITEIRAHLGPNGEEHLVESGLGERLSDGEVRVRGAIAEDGTDRLGWYKGGGIAPSPDEAPRAPTARDQRRVAGSSRAAKAVRGPGGRFVRAGSAGGPAGPADDQRTASGVVPLVQRTTSGNRSAGGSDPDLDPEEKNSPARAGSAGDFAGPAGPADGPADGHQRSSGPADGDPLAAARALGAAAEQLWAELAEQRARLATELRVELRPLHPQDPGERDLRDRLRESRTLEEGVANARHVISMALLEARASGSPQFLTGALFGERAWRRALGMTAQDAKRAGEAKRQRQPQPEAEPVRRIKTLG